MTESAARTRAKAIITVREFAASAYDEPTEGPSLSRVHLAEVFSGDIIGVGEAELLVATRPDGQSSLAGIERVTGELGARHGTFLFQVAGTVQDDIVTGDLVVIAGSGTGRLADLRGEAWFRATFGESADVDLDYWFE
jgi:hypothetical protein